MEEHRNEGTLGLKRVINAWGKATKYGASRSPESVGQATAEALMSFYDVAALEALVGAEIAALAQAEAGCLTHCTAAAITLSAAACMTGADLGRIEQLPDTTGMANRVIIQAGHCVYFGSSVTQMLRLSGANVTIVGHANRCFPHQLTHELRKGDVACVFAVESRLASQHTTLPLQTVIELAHDANVPVVVDGAAQDQRLHEIIAAGADLVLSGVQKYLRGPTAGMVAGKKALVKAVSMQQQGIGRTMKPSKEALMGTLAAIHHRRTEQPEQLIKQYCETVELVANSLQTLPGVSTRLQPDPTNHLFSLLRVDFDTKEWPTPLPQMVADVATGDPILALAPHFAPSGYLLLEVHEMKPDEIAQMTEILREYQRTHAG